MYLIHLGRNISSNFKAHPTNSIQKWAFTGSPMSQNHTNTFEMVQTPFSHELWQVTRSSQKGQLLKKGNIGFEPSPCHPVVSEGKAWPINSNALHPLICRHLQWETDNPCSILYMGHSIPFRHLKYHFSTRRTEAVQEKTIVWANVCHS